MKKQKNFYGGDRKSCNQNNIMIKILINLCFVLLCIGNVSGVTCECDSCSDCTTDLNDVSCDDVILTTNINAVGTCINDPDDFNGKTFDCQNYTITGNGNGYAFYLDSQSNNNIKNCVIENFYDGFRLQQNSNTNTIQNNFINNSAISGVSIRITGSNYNVVEDNVVNNSGSDGILLLYSSHSTIIDNRVDNSGRYAIFGDGEGGTTFDNIITYNNINNSIYGIYIRDSKENDISNNIVHNADDYGIWIRGVLSTDNVLNFNSFCGSGISDIKVSDVISNGDNNFCDSTDNYNDSGTVGCSYSCGECECYCYSCDDCEDKLSDIRCKIVFLNNSIDNNVGVCINNPIGFNNKTFDCKNNTITDIRNYEGSMGIYVDDKNNISVYNCSIKEFEYGIFLSDSNYSNISYNNVNLNDYGILLSLSNYNNILYNKISENNWHGFVSGIGSDNNIINNNQLCSNIEYDIRDLGSNSGDNNTCDTAYNYNDTGEVGCSFSCEYGSCFCVSCDDCESKLNNPDCPEVFLSNNINEINGTCILGLTRPFFKDKIFNCQNYTITGDRNYWGNTGIYLCRDNYGVVIKNCDIFNFSRGVFVYKSDNNIIQNSLIRGGGEGVEISDSAGVNIINSDVMNNYGNGVKIFKSNDVTVIGSSIYNNTFTGVVSWGVSSNSIKLLSNNIILNDGGVYFLDTTLNSELYNNMICRNMEKNGSYDILDRGSNVGDNNYCDYVSGWSDKYSSGCRFLCSGNFTPPSENITEEENETEETEPVNISDDIQEKINDSYYKKPAFESIEIIVENFGFKSSSSKVLFVILFKIIVDLFLVMYGVNWRIILILNVFMLLCFAIIGWIPFYIVLLIMVISALIFGVILKNIST